MSYGRNPYYIYANGEEIFFDGVCIPENVIDAFLYKMLLSNRREELKGRLLNGKRIWFKNQVYVDNEGYISPLPKDNRMYKMDIEWMEKQEDNIIKMLMGENTIKEVRSVELDYFCNNFNQIVKQYKDKWVCIKGEEVVSSGDTLKEANDKCKELGVKRPFMTRVTEEGWSRELR